MTIVCPNMVNEKKKPFNTCLHRDTLHMRLTNKLSISMNYSIMLRPTEGGESSAGVGDHLNNPSPIILL